MACVILGYDDSPGAKRALSVAIHLADSYDDDLVIAFGYAPPSTMGEEYQETTKALEEVGERLTSEALALARESGVNAEVALVPDRPAAALVALAAERDARYIVVGSYGESPLKGAILGSTPHKLLHLSEVPVVVVPAA